ncbi:hypothetical protein M407DRAFT_26788 [Tulasnella calospora MUT 4182]|uniref:Protein kinase domain-containing protein n=1 Tax=Tulasnella calospora MUT 4182 TaxID=1051891 RepID=A0A0C3QF44_9AGAM|nr:hypothetical protein M407DRAFT_26788 [Tulasnella calospora MUT 4182]
MADTMAPQSLDQDRNKPREIVNEVSGYRIDPIRIKMTDPTAGKKGGQGVVTVGTLSLPAVVKQFLFKLKTAAEEAGRSPEELKIILPELKGELKEWPPEMPVDVAVEMLRVPPEVLKEWLPEVKVAVKRLEWNRDGAEESTKFFKSFVYELSLMAELSHPNIIQLVGFVENIDKGDAWIILPWEANGNIREFLQSGEWDLPERLSLIQDTAKGLEYLHSHEPPICHGDLKSLNILVNSSYRAVITDFGSARIRRNVAARDIENRSGGALLNDGVTAGGNSPEVKFNPSTSDLTLTGPGFSLRWIAPEVLCGEEQGLPSDVWAIGWICWETITGRMPFEDLNTDGAIIMHTINGRLPAIREDLDLSNILSLCSIMSECWLLEPVKRIDASSFQRKVKIIPSATPSDDASGGQKTRSAHLLLELGRIHSLQGENARAMFYSQSALDVAIRTKNELAKGNALECLARIHRIQSKYHEAEEASTEAYEIQSRIDNDMGAANALHGLGEVYWAQSKHHKAEKAFMEAHEIHSRIGSDLGAANALHGLGHIYRAQSQHREAEKAFMDAHEIHSRIGNDMGAANSLSGLGNIYQAQSKHREAEKAFIEAHEIHSRIGQHLGVANALDSLGQIYQAQSKHREAEKALVEAHEIHSRIGNNLGAANALYGLGEVYRAQSKYSEAEKVFREAHEIHSRIGHDLGTANALNVLGLIYLAQSKYGEAEKAFMEAHEIQSRIGNDLGAANALHSLGDIYRAQLQHREAEKAFMEAHEIHSRIGHELGAANALNGLGDIYGAHSKHRKAEKVLMEAHDIHSRIGNDLGAGNALDSLGQIYLAQSKHREAEKAFMESYETHSRIGSDLGTANALLGLGGVYQAQSKHHEAEKAFIDAHAIHSRTGNNVGAADALLGLGNTYRAQSRNSEAEKPFNDALKISLPIDNHLNAGNTLKSLGNLYQDQYKYDQAEMSYRQALAAYDRADDADSRAITLFILGGIHNAQGRYLDAEEAVAEALAIWISLANDRLQAVAYRRFADIFESQSKHTETIDALIQAEGAFARAGEDDDVRASTLHGLGNIHVKQGRYAEAEGYYHLAQAIFSSVGDARGEAPVLLRLGDLHFLQHRQDEAEECFTQARAAYAIVADQEGEGDALDRLMVVYGVQGKFADSKAACMEAYEIYAQSGEPMTVEMVGMPLEELEGWLPEMKVAVKMLEWNRNDAEESTKFFKSFVHELSLMAELSHPNVIKLAGFLEDLDKGDAWMILPWEANGNVREFLQSGEWDLPERLSLIKDTAKGLEHLHSHQPPICHGDLKPLKVLVKSLTVRLSPTLAAGESSPEVTFNPLTSDLTLSGAGFSLRWIAPEVLRGEEQDLPNDMWAIGWICWETVTGRKPFEDLNTDGAIIMHRINGKLPAIREDMVLSHVLMLCGIM